MQFRKTSSKKTNKTNAGTAAASEPASQPQVSSGRAFDANVRAKDGSSTSKSREKKEVSLKQGKTPAAPPAPEEVVPVVSENLNAEARPVEKAMAAAAGAVTGARNSPEAARRETSSVGHEDVARLAHSYWAARGYPNGSAEEDWYRAERELKTKSGR